eukprot:523758_1
MATTKDLLSLQRKIALDSYHHTIHNHSERRPNILRHDSNRSNKANNSQFKHKSHSTSQLSSKSKPSKRTRKRRKHDIGDYFHHNQRNKPKTPNIMPVKQLIDRKLLHQYQQYVEERVQMLRSRAFPYEIIHRLSQYRTDLSDCLTKVLPKPYYSLHTEANQLAQSEQQILKQTLKTYKNKKTSKLKSIKKNIIAPIQPIKKLFINSNKHKNFKESFNTNYTITQLSPPSDNYNNNELEGHTKTINKSKSMSPHVYKKTELNKNEFPIIETDCQVKELETKSVLHKQKRNKQTWNIEVIPSPVPALASDDHDEYTPDPSLESTLPVENIRLKHSRTLNLAELLIELPEEKTDLKRAHTTAVTVNKNSYFDHGDHDFATASASATPPFFTERSDNIRNMTEHIFDESNLPFNTPSWALRDSTNSHTEMPDTMPVNEVKMNVLETKYNNLELICQDLQIALREIQVTMNENNITVNLMQKRMRQMQNEIKEFECVDGKMPLKLRDELVEENVSVNNVKDSGFLDKLKNKILEEQNIISFERSKWENIYHSLFCYFMNGLMVIFNMLMRVYILFGFGLKILHKVQIIGMIILILALFLMN